jgi:hypothetical protein
MEYFFISVAWNIGTWLLPYFMSGLNSGDRAVSRAIPPRVGAPSIAARTLHIYRQKKVSACFYDAGCCTVERKCLLNYLFNLSYEMFVHALFYIYN